jgi:hypothetical protein
MVTRRRKRKSGKRKSHHKGHIPLEILEKRARKLNRLVASRGGSV